MKRSELRVGQEVKDRHDWQSRLVVMDTQPWAYLYGRHKEPKEKGNGVAVAVHDAGASEKDGVPRWYPAVYQLQDLWTVEQYELDLERAKVKAAEEAAERRLEAERKAKLEAERQRDREHRKLLEQKYAAALALPDYHVWVSPAIDTTGRSVQIPERVFLDLMRDRAALDRVMRQVAHANDDGLGGTGDMREVARLIVDTFAQDLEV